MIEVLYIIGGEGKRYGSEIIAMDLLAAGKENGIRYTAVVANRGVVSEFCERNGIACIVVPFTFFVYKEPGNPLLKFVKKTIWKNRAEFLTKRAAKVIARTVDMKKIDVIHTNLSRDMLGGLLSRKYDIPHIWHIQELFRSHYQLTFLKKDQVRWMDEHADRFIAISDTVAKEWGSNGLTPERITTVMNGVDLSPIRTKETYTEDGELKMLMIGHLCPAKGQDQIIRKLAQVPSEIREHITLSFIGDGEESYQKLLKEQAEASGVKIRLLGYCDHIGDVLADYDIGLNCSRGEGFGLTTVEYMAAGLCVLAADTGANTELIRDGENGVLFSYADDADFAKQVVFMYNNREKTAAIGEAAKQYALQNFALPNMQQKVYTLYRKVSRREEKQEK